MSEFDEILEAMRNGDRQASDRLIPLVYHELRRLAARKMAHEPSGLTLQATALVHEAYVRLVAPDASGNTPKWDHRGHFLIAAGEAMRRILVERARRKRAERHGGEFQRVAFHGAIDKLIDSDDHDSFLALNDAMTRFAAEHPDEAQLVSLRYFAGLKETEAAEVMDISRATASRYWSFARAWLFDALK